MNNLGSVIKILRKENNLTQEKLGELCDCSKRTIIRIEKNEIAISPYMQNRLNYVFNININLYDYLISTYGSYQTYLICQEMAIAVSNRDINKLLNFIKEYKHAESFAYPTPTLYIGYVEVICLNVASKNYKKSINKALKLLNVKTLDELYDALDSKYFSNTTLLIINTLTINFDALGDIENSFIISQKLFNYFEKNIFNNSFTQNTFDSEIKNKYLAIINNYADNLFQMENYEECNRILDIGISKLKDFQTTISIDYIYALKVEVTYKLGLIEESKECFNFFTVFCKFKSNEAFLEKKINDFKKNAPNLF